MAVYETGTSTGPADLIGTKLAAFAATNGWTVQNVAGGFKQFLKGSTRVNLSWDTESISGQMSGGYAGGSAWDAQPTPSGIVTLGNIHVGPYTAYHFYSGTESSSDYLHMAVEWSAGNFWHSYMGQLVKFGTYTGGQYYESLYVDPSWHQLPTVQAGRAPFDDWSHGGASNAGQLRADIDAKTDNWMMQSYSWDGNRYCGGMRGGLYINLVHPIAYQKYNSLTPIHPVVVFVDRGSSLRSPFGRVPDLRQVSMRNLTPGQVITIGSDDWQCFPLWTRSDAEGVFAGNPQMSWYFGIAYKR